MSDLTNVFTNIADAIRAKTETQITYKPTEMADAINNISGGGVFEVTTGRVNTSFNMPVNIPNGVIDMSYAFLGFYNFNQPVNIPDSVTNVAFAFSGCQNFNQLVSISNNATNMDFFLANCYNFNQPINIPDSIIYLNSGFQSCFSLNQPVKISNNAKVLRNTFRNCNNLNQPMIIPNSVTQMSDCFLNCSKLNQPIIMPNNVSVLSGCFNGCSNFNQPIIMPNTATLLPGFLFRCYNFNQSISIPDSVTNVTLCFGYCNHFNQPICMSNNITNVSYCFQLCYNFSSNLYIFTSMQKTAAKNMFYQCNPLLPKHIFTNNTNAFNGTAATDSITGTAITWTRDGANYYNTGFNIYIHNVANPYTVLNNANYSFDSQPSLPDSPAIVFGSGVRNLRSAFSSVSLNSNNTLILFEEGVEDLSRCFVTQSHFNQPLTIPSSAVDCREILSGCSNFNSPVVFRNGVRDLRFTFDSCSSFDKDVWIPESVTNLRDTFYGCTAFESGSGIVHISHNIALGDTSNYIYSAFTVISGEDGTESGLFIPLDPSRILNDY